MAKNTKKTTPSSSSSKKAASEYKIKPIKLPAKELKRKK